MRVGANQPTPENGNSHYICQPESVQQIFSKNVSRVIIMSSDEETEASTSLRAEANAARRAFTAAQPGTSRNNRFFWEHKKKHGTCGRDGFTCVPRVPCRWHTILSHAPGLLGRVLLWNQVFNALLSVNFLLTSPCLFPLPQNGLKMAGKRRSTKGIPVAFKAWGCHTRCTKVSCTWGTPLAS